jgi:hypothetical protein
LAEGGLKAPSSTVLIAGDPQLRDVIGFVRRSGIDITL